MQEGFLREAGVTTGSGDTFDRPPGESLSWFAEDAEPNADAVGHVPWWPDGQDGVTLHFVLAYVLAETSRHAGHAGIVRELIGGQASWRPGDDSMPEGDASWCEDYVDRLERAAWGADWT